MLAKNFEKNFKDNVGEIFKKTMISKGYWNNEKMTRKMLFWMEKTGDLGK